MFCDVFNKKQALQLLENKKIWFIGSSNMRAIYKDVLWLITHGTLAADVSFKIKNEQSYLNDRRLSNDTLHNGRNYKEIREYKSDKIHLYFHFITRLYLDHFLEQIDTITPENCPDVILLNSCLWDLSRWGPNGPKTFKTNLLKTLKHLKTKIPAGARMRVIWKTSLPVSTAANGAIFCDEIRNIVPMLPWHILEANNYAATCATFFNFDTLDVHYYMRLQGHLRVKDGIHWCPVALRYITNVFLTHLALSWGVSMPGNWGGGPCLRFLAATTKTLVAVEQLDERVKKKEGFFRKLFDRKEFCGGGSVRDGIRNRFLTAGRMIARQTPVKVVKRKLTRLAERFRGQRRDFNPYLNYKW